MLNPVKMSSVALATIAAGLFAINAPVFAGAEGKSEEAGKETVHCVGVNACKGMSSCAGADNSCSGHNSCKGKGFVEMSRKACEQIGGKAEKA